MKILTNGDYVDFEAPIYMDEQRNKFIGGMKKIFGKDIEIGYIIEKKKEMGDIARTQKKFTEEDLLLLGNPDLNNEEVAKRLNKTPFAIQMKRGNWLPEFQDWARKKKINTITEEDLKQFLEETF